jgi:hypothetical protein
MVRKRNKGGRGEGVGEEEVKKRNKGFGHEPFDLHSLDISTLQLELEPKEEKYRMCASRCCMYHTEAASCCDHHLTEIIQVENTKK